MSASEQENGNRKHQKLLDDEKSVLFIPKKGDSSKLRKVTSSKEPNIKKYLSMGKEELQKWLRHNSQLVTGNKKQLLLRCVDGQLNGRIPKCPRCHQGQMQYDYENRQYVCNGYFDDMSKTPIRCGHTESEVKRQKWHDVEKDSPVKSKVEERNSSIKSSQNHHVCGDSEHHQHGEHHCKVDANHALVDMLEDLAFYHSVLRDENWGYKSRAYSTAARAVEELDFEVKDALSLGDSKSDKHVERVGKSSAEAMQAFIDSGKKRCPQLEDIKGKVEGSEEEEH